MIIDNLKEFMAKLSDTSQKNNDCYEEDVLGGDPVCEKEFETDEDKDAFPEILGGIQAPDIYIGDMYGPAPGYDDDFGICDHDDDIDEPIPNVYGPDPGYDDKDLVTCVHDEDDIIEKKDAQR